MRQKSPCDDPALHAGQRDGAQKRLVARIDERRRTLSGQQYVTMSEARALDIHVQVISSS